MGDPKRRDFTVGDISSHHVFVAVCGSYKCHHHATVPRQVFNRFEQHLLIRYIERQLKCTQCGNKQGNSLYLENGR